MTTSQADLNRIWEIQTALGGTWKFHRDRFATATEAELIREWLILKGVPTIKVDRMSLKGLNNAYAAGDKFVRKLCAIDLDLDIGDPSKPGMPLNLLGIEPKFDYDYEKELEIESPIDNTGDHIPDPEPSPLDTETHTTAVVKQAVEAIIPPRLSKIARDLHAELSASKQDLISAVSREVQGKFQSMEDQIATNLETNLTHEISLATDRMLDAAAKAVHDEIEKSLPRRLELWTPSGLLRELPAKARHCKFDTILRWLMAGENVYIVGPAGTGKTHLFAQLAEALGKKQWSIGQSLTKYDLSGYKSPTGDYIGTILRDAIEQGGLVTIDEGDMWAAAALGFLNQPLANGYCAFPDRVIEVHPDFQCMIAANTYGHGATMQYQGRNPLDAASLDRFVYEEVDYDPDLETQLYGRGPWVQYVHRVRQAVEDLKLQHVISMRAINRCLRGEAAGFDAEHIAQGSLWRSLAPDSVSKIKSLAGPPPGLRPDLREVG